MLFFSLLEFSLFSYDYLKDSGYMSPFDKVHSQINSAQFPGQNPKMSNVGTNCHWTDMFKTHPYLMYAKKADTECSDYNINEQGFHGPAYPINKIPKTFIIMFSGGSVAEDQMGSEKITSLENVLNDNYKIDGYDNFKVIVGALAGWRMPNQMIMMALYSSVIDGFINLDGFNEFELIQQPNGRTAGYPADPFVMQGINDPLDVWKYLFAKCDGYIFKQQLSSNFLINFRSYYYLTEIARSYCRKTAVSINLNDSSYMNYFIFPKNMSTQDIQRKYNSEKYLSYYRNMSAIAKSNKIKEIYFIQPSPAFKNFLTEEEHKLNQDLSYKQLYEKMTNERLALIKEKIPVVSLVDIFKNTKERIYLDKIHPNAEGRKILEQQILLNLEKHWDLKRKNPNP